MLPEPGGFHTTWAIVDLDGGAVAAALHAGPLTGLAEADVATISASPTRRRPGRRWTPGTVEAAIVIPAGFSDARSPRRAADLWSSAARSDPLGELARSVLAGFGAGSGHPAGGARAADRPAGPGRRRWCPARRERLAIPDPVAVATRRLTARPTSDLLAASMAVLFVFFAAQFGVVGLLADGATARWRGCSRRPSRRAPSCWARCS